MKRFKLTAMMLAFTLAAAMALPGCAVIDKVNKQAGEKGDILESEYIIDKESGEFTTVVIVQNNSDYTLLENLYMPDAYDENGNKIEEYSEDEGSITSQFGLSSLCYWLGSGEKTALVNSSCTERSAYNDGNKITDFYKAMPEKLDWHLTQSYDKQLMALAGELGSHGLSVSECREIYTDTDYAEYEVTIHNDSSTDYTGDPSDGTFRNDAGEYEFTFCVAAVYRDSEGKIRDAVKMVPFFETEEVIAAGSDTTLTFSSNHSCYEDFEPEYYICITELKRTGNADAS